jgi:hypothetical protein
LRSKSDTGQINEALCKVLCHNICVLVHAIHSLNIEPIFRQPLEVGWRPKTYCAENRLFVQMGLYVQGRVCLDVSPAREAYRPNP